MQETLTPERYCNNTMDKSQDMTGTTDNDTQDNVGWKTPGSIFNFINEELYDEKWIKNIFP